MITNEVQYRSTKAHLEQFEEAARNVEAGMGPKPSKLARLELDAVLAQAEDLRAKLHEYEQLRSGAVSTFEGSSLAELATVLVKARIARGGPSDSWPRRSASPSSRFSGTRRRSTGRPAWLASATWPRPWTSPSPRGPSCGGPTRHE